MITDGKYYMAKRSANAYSPELQKCIEEACSYCEKSRDGEDADQPIMLLGRIQSGKTRAFTGVMAMAFDNHFDMAIILTKNSKALVKQTYARMRREFQDEIRANEVEVLDIMRTFDDELTEYELGKKLVIVLKKEPRNLNRISDFISKYTLHHRKNCLIIDDEADAAGIGFCKSKDADEEFYLRKVASEVNSLRGTLRGCAFLQVTATPYALFLQPEIESDLAKPIKPYRTVLVPCGEGYIGGEYYFLESRNDEHPGRFIFEPVSEEENDLVSTQRRKRKSDIDDRRRFKIENVIRDQKRLSMFKKGLMNFVVGGCVLRLSNANAHYSYVIHTATQKSSHMSLGDVTKEFFKQIRLRDPEIKAVVDQMINDSYDDIRRSYTAYGFQMPDLNVVRGAVYEAVDRDYISLTVVNSDKEMETILDEDTGELRLRSPLSVFVGGQAIDRGVTIPNMIGFYYGRNPKTMQQDTVMQHSRMFGYRKRELLSVTRFYTTRRIYENMTLISEMDKALRDGLEKKTFADGVYFLQQHSQEASSAGSRPARIVPCAPSKIALSSTVLFKPHMRILPVGFSPTERGLTVSREIADILEQLGKLKAPGSEVISVPVSEAARIVTLAYSVLVPDRGAARFIPVDHFVSALNYLSQRVGEVLIYTRHGRRIAKYRANGIAYQDAPDTGYELERLRPLAINTPVLMLIHQDGTGKGWGGNPFWWPVIIVQADAKATMFALPEASGKIVT